MVSKFEYTWSYLVEHLNFGGHDFCLGPKYLLHSDVKDIIAQRLNTNGEPDSLLLPEIRNLGYQSTKSKRPDFFKQNNLVLLPASNNSWVIAQGSGYVDIPVIESDWVDFNLWNLTKLDTISIGSKVSESQYLDFSLINGVINDFCDIQDDLFLTLRGRQRLEEVEFTLANKVIKCNGVQIEIDAGYESKNEVVLIEAKSVGGGDSLIRQIYLPYRYVEPITQKKIRNIFFQALPRQKAVNMYEFVFDNKNAYDSIKLVKKSRYKLNL